MYCIKYSESIVERRIAYSDLSRDLCRLRLLSRLRLRFFALQQHTMISIRLLSYGMNTAEALELEICLTQRNPGHFEGSLHGQSLEWYKQNNTGKYNIKSKQHKIQQNYASSFASYDTQPGDEMGLQCSWALTIYLQESCAIAKITRYISGSNEPLWRYGHSKYAANLNLM